MNHERENKAPARRRAAWLAAIIAAGLLLAGCADIPGGRPSPPVTCTFGAPGADVQVQIADDSVPCSQEVAALATDGQNWQPIASLSPAGSAGTADGETLSQTCRLTKGGSVITVMDAGGAIYGSQICSSQEQNGWAP